MDSDDKTLKEACENIIAASGALPIVKYEGMLWYYDERCNELRDYYTAEPRRLDSGEIDKYYFSKLVVEVRPTVVIYDADADQDDFDHVPRVLRDELRAQEFEKLKEGKDD